MSENLREVWGIFYSHCIYSRPHPTDCTTPPGMLIWHLYADDRLLRKLTAGVGHNEMMSAHSKPTYARLVKDVIDVQQGCNEMYRSIEDDRVHLVYSVLRHVVAITFRVDMSTSGPTRCSQSSQREILACTSTDDKDSHQPRVDVVLLQIQTISSLHLPAHGHSSTLSSQA